VEGLPQQPGAVGLAVLVLGLVVGAIYGLRFHRHVAGAFAGQRTVAWIVAVLVAVGIGGAPFIAWRIVEDIRYTSAIDPWLMPRYGVSVFRVHPEIFDNAAARIPPGDTYYVASASGIDGTSRAAFRQWALGYLLPRAAVADPARAQWILTLGLRPASVGPAIERTWLMKEPVSGLPAAYLGKVASS
jgi:hypothetical protein